MKNKNRIIWRESDFIKFKQSNWELKKTNCKRMLKKVINTKLRLISLLKINRN